MTTVQTLSATIRGRRKALGVSQSGLATMAGVSRKFISQVEGGKDTVELGLVLALFDALDITVHLEVSGSRGSPSEVPSARTQDLDQLMRDYQAGE